MHPVYIVWPEWKKGAPYFASAFSLLAVCNDVLKEGRRKRAEAVSSVRCRAFHSLSFHDERPCHRFECFARSPSIGSEKKEEKKDKKKKKKDKEKGRANRLGKTEPGNTSQRRSPGTDNASGTEQRERAFGLFREYNFVVRVSTLRSRWWWWCEGIVTCPGVLLSLVICH